ncbi:hypothetical protein [Paenibacillus sp. 481]|nr:hypothetical protein [Paenibacillus sp. 481]UHA73382.1 hypothetical protein KIK04_22920 [Paenibacillus sp. 481]
MKGYKSKPHPMFPYTFTLTKKGAPTVEVGLTQKKQVFSIKLIPAKGGRK